MATKAKATDGFEKLFNLESGRKYHFEVKVNNNVTGREETHFRISIPSQDNKELTMMVYFHPSGERSVLLSLIYLKDGKEVQPFDANARFDPEGNRNTLLIVPSGILSHDGFSYHKLLDTKRAKKYRSLLLHAVEAYTDNLLVNVLPDANPELNAKIVEVAAILTDLKDSIELTHGNSTPPPSFLR